MDLINYKLQQLTMVLPTLPNDIILKIIKQADGGLNTHKKKMSPVLTAFMAVVAFKKIQLYFDTISSTEDLRTFYKVVREAGYDPTMFIRPTEYADEE